ILILIALSYGISVPLANKCAGYDNSYYFYEHYKNGCFAQAYAPAMSFITLCILIIIIYGLVVVIKKRKAPIQKGVTDVINDNQAHEVIIEEEADLGNEVRMLEKQKRIAELKKEIKDLEAVHLAAPKSIIAKFKSSIRLFQNLEQCK
ncbi:16415_t:CDS:1, partial [Cetraspora pellucida]